MKRTAIRLAAAAIALVASAGNADAQGSFGIAGGLSMPTGDLGKTTDAGYYVSAMLGISPPLSPLGFRVDGFWNSLSGANGAEDARILGATANLTLGMAGILVKPYLIAGGGVYNAKQEFTFAGVTSSDSETRPGANGGVGLKFGLSGFSTFLEARAHVIFQKGGDKTTFVPITFGILF